MVLRMPLFFQANQLRAKVMVTYRYVLSSFYLFYYVFCVFLFLQLLMETPGYRLLFHSLVSHQWIKDGWFCFPRQGAILIHTKFTRRSEVHDRTRYNKDLNLPRCRLKTGQRSFAYRGATCWNRLPKDLKEVVNTGTFKKRLVNMLLT